MSVNAVETITINDLSKGMNNWDQPHRLEEGYYVYGLNTYMPRRHPQSRTGQTLLNTNTPSNGTIIWAEPYTDKDGTTTILVATGSDVNTFASFYKYTAGTDTWTHLYTKPSLGHGEGIGTFGGRINSVVYDNLLIVLPAGNPTTMGTFPFKWNGTDLWPVGAMKVADFESGETWTVTSGTATANTTEFVYKTQSRKFTTGAVAYLDFSPAKNFTAGPGAFADSTMWSSAATNLSTAARLIGYFYKHQATNLTLAVKFYSNVGSDISTTLTFSTTGAGTGWGSFGHLRSGGASGGGGACDFAAVTRVQITVSGGSGSDAVSVDMMSWAHDDTLRARAGHLVEVYKEQLMIGNYNNIEASAPNDSTASYVHRNGVARSPAGEIDVYDNASQFSGGKSILEGIDYVSALRAYFDLLVVGKPTSTWSFSGTGDNIAINAQQTTVGVDSHKIVVEVPWSLLFSFEYNVFGNRLTNRSILSLPVREQMEDISYALAAICRATAHRWDAGHQVKMAWLKAGSSATSGLDRVLYYDYQLNAWTGVGSAASNKDKVVHWTRYIDSNDVRRLLVIDGANNYLKVEDSGAAYFQPSNTVIPAELVLPYYSAKGDPETNKTQWIGVWLNIKQAAAVATTVQVRYADLAEDLQDGDSTTGFSTIQTITGTDHTGMQFVRLGGSARYCQIKLATADSRGDWAVMLPIKIEYIPSLQRR